MPIFTFRCPAGHTAEKLVRDRETSVIPCECGLNAGRDAVYSMAFSGFAATPVGQQDMREDFRRFREASEGLEYKHERLEDSRQQRLAPPPLYKAAHRKAESLAKGGVTADQL